MDHYSFAREFRQVYDAAVSRFAAGRRDAATLLEGEEVRFAANNGLTVQNFLDYAEDHLGYGGEPGPDQALAIELVRRDYFLNAQGGCPSAAVLDEATLPAKAEAVRGIAWLPRLIPKARAKLRGELPSSLMYGCGGDRRFFREHNILPSEFLTLTWRHGNDTAAIIDWVIRRKSGRG